MKLNTLSAACLSTLFAMPVMAEEMDHSNMDHSKMNHAQMGHEGMAQHDHSSRADSHAPIGVMGDHTHNEGEWMLSYRYMTMSMTDTLDGTKKVSDDEVLAGFMVAPKSMTMQMHMFGAMYAPSNALTVGFMLPYIENDMKLVMEMPMMGSGMAMPMTMRTNFETQSKGIGDLKAVALYSLFANDTARVHLNMGLSLPTGSIDEKDATAMSGGQDIILPYPMQLGSGTYDVMPGITYNGTQDSYSYGAQLNAVLRTFTNERDYRLGNRYQAQAWAAVPIAQFMSLSIRGDYEQWGNIVGEDSDLNPMMVPTARKDLRAGKQFSTAVGVNFLLPAGNRIALEYEVPVYQDLDGPQLAADPMFTLGWQLVL
ncbi:MAG: transporter [Oleispira sp.]|nr:transporter [Oleispira sp.]MBL4882738.1 transporter [Oleispira sp.]